MLIARVPDGTGVVYVQIPPTFRMTDLDRLVQDVLAGTWADVSLSMPFILDARAVPMDGIPAAEISRHLMRRLALTGAPRPGPLVAIGRDLPSQAKLRLYCVLAHVMRLRDEGQSHVTGNLHDAVCWVVDRFPTGGVDSTTLSRLIGDMRTKWPGIRDFGDSTP